ncbi:unnamed protein product [Rhizoctonia solani]|uniref:R3H domain-containing protein n=1 Tax=Rhizoctonia solani TaxID=456999 RepID=A0A8H3E584_9AGAM|nr:unnamed protein product [Rhizoctonia solani]
MSALFDAPYLTKVPRTDLPRCQLCLVANHVGDYWDARSTLASWSVIQGPVLLVRFWTSPDAIAVNTRRICLAEWESLKAVAQRDKAIGRGGGNVKKFVIGILIAATTNAKSPAIRPRKLLPFAHSRPPSLRHAHARRPPSRLSAPHVPTPFLLVLSHAANLILGVDTHAPSAIAARVSCGTSGAPKNVHHAAPLAGNRSTVGTIHATGLAILATVGHARKFVESPEKNVDIPALSPVMRLPPAHQSMRYLVQWLSPLADALGISESGRTSGHNQVTWNPNLIAFARAPPNQPFIKNMEKALADFVTGDKKAHVLPYMPEIRRKIVTEVAEVYRITTQLVDEEPRRSVQLIRRIDSRVPTPLLSQASVSTPSRLGSLGDLRKPATVLKPASPSGSSASTAPAWRSGTPSGQNTNATLGPAPNSGSPTSGTQSSGSDVTPWVRPNVPSPARTPIPPTASRVAPTSLGGGETREDVPANWEDE